jgi:hypothetical protein
LGGDVECLLYGSASATAPIDQVLTPIPAHGAAQAYDVNLSGIVTIDAPPSSPTMTTLPTDKTAVFKCITQETVKALANKVSFTSIAMTDTFERYATVPLNVKVLTKVAP